MRAAEPRAQDRLWQSSTRHQSPLNRRLRDRARSLPTGLAKEGRTKRAQRVDKPWGFSEPDFPLGESFGGAQRARAGRWRARLTVSTSSAAGSPQTHARPAPLSRAPFSRPCSLFAGFQSVCSLFLYLLNDLEHFFFFPFRTHKWALALSPGNVTCSFVEWPLNKNLIKRTAIEHLRKQSYPNVMNNCICTSLDGRQVIRNR